MMERRVRQLVAEYVPQCEQEQRDKAQMLAFFQRESGWLTRENCPGPRDGLRMDSGSGG